MQRLFFAPLAILMLIGPISCQADNVDAQHKPSSKGGCAIPAGAFESLPVDVLVGTDISKVGTFEGSPVSPGSFLTETGGATIKLTLHEKGSGYTAERGYTEPGMPASTKSYSELCREGSRLYGDSVRAKLVEGGILWLELESGNTFIPDSLWLYLESIEQGEDK